MTAFRPIDISPYRPATLRDQAQPQLMWVALADCVVDHRYQRTITSRGQQAIQRMADNWDWQKYQPILIAPADGGRSAIVDGQHRAHAALTAGIASLPAMVVPMTLQEQALSFAAVNTDRIKMDKTALFRAQLAAGEPWAVQAEELVREAGCVMATFHPSSSNRKPGYIYSPGTIRKMIEAGEAAAITPGLRAIRASTCAGDLYCYSDQVLKIWLPALAANQRYLTLDLPHIFGGIDFFQLYDDARRRARATGGSPVQLVRAQVDAILKSERAAHA